ncbi:metal-dependent hydrolase [Halobacteriales archaeon QS_1_68_17]|nr:MAG: metal-dependent hydrolase [Halobacteriales archaeon QS_1_68_17]
MYRTGHYGAALLCYAPLGALLLVAGRPGLAVVGGAGVLALARLPDHDLRVPLLSHRGPTHTLLFAAIVGLAVGGVGWLLGSGEAFGSAGGPVLAGLGVLVGTLAVVSHLLADALTPAGVTPFWPFSSRNYSFGVATADNPIANYGLLALGVFVSVLLAVALR